AAGRGAPGDPAAGGRGAGAAGRGAPGDAAAGGRGGAGGAPRGAGGAGVLVFEGTQVLTSTSQQSGGRGGGPSTGIFAGNGAILIGSKGILATSQRGEGVALLPAARWKEYVLPPQLLTRSPGHMADWIRACKGGGPSCSDFSVTASFAGWLALAVIAWRVPGKLEWDSQNLRFTNNREANRYVKPLMRKG